MADDDATPIEAVANLGPVSAGWLRAIGVTTLGELRARDLIDVWITVRLHEPKASRLLYYGMWGAVHGRDWRTIGAADKARFDRALRERGLATPARARPGARHRRDER